MRKLWNGLMILVVGLVCLGNTIGDASAATYGATIEKGQIVSQSKTYTISTKRTYWIGVKNRPESGDEMTYKLYRFLYRGIGDYRSPDRELIQQGDLLPGHDYSFPMSLQPGDYVIELSCKQGSCNGSGVIIDFEEVTMQ